MTYGETGQLRSPALEVAAQLPIGDGLVELHPLVAGRGDEVVEHVVAERRLGGLAGFSSSIASTMFQGMRATSFDSYALPTNGASSVRP